MFIVGHRGARGEAPENTLEGFLYALNNGIRDFELDIRLTGDRELVVFHDATLNRATHQKGTIAAIPSDELIKHDTRIGTIWWDKPAPIPTLKSVFELVGPDVTIQLEVKPGNKDSIPHIGRRLLELVDQFKRHENSVVTSLDPNVLFWFKNNAPHLKRGYVAEYRFPNPLAIAESLKCQFLCPNYKMVTRRLVEKAHQRGLHVSPWTVNRAEEWLYLASLGVDSVITDYPTKALQYI